MSRARKLDTASAVAALLGEGGDRLVVTTETKHIDVERIHERAGRAKPIKVERRDGTIDEVDVETVLEGLVRKNQVEALAENLPICACCGKKVAPVDRKRVKGTRAIFCCRCPACADCGVTLRSSSSKRCRKCANLRTGSTAEAKERGRALGKRGAAASPIQTEEAKRRILRGATNSAIAKEMRLPISAVARCRRELRQQHTRQSACKACERGFETPINWQGPRPKLCQSCARPQCASCGRAHAAHAPRSVIECKSGRPYQCSPCSRRARRKVA